MNTLNDLAEVIDKLQGLEGGEEAKEFSIAHVQKELEKASRAFPNDMVMRRVSALITNMYSKDRWQTIRDTTLAEYFNTFDTVASSSNYR